MYESKEQRPLKPAQFATRLLKHFSLAVGLLLLSLGLGVLGYMYFESLPALDGFVNSAMLLGGMGPVNPPVHASGKLFAGLYALYAGLVFLVAAGLVLAPVVHRLLHTFHWDPDDLPATPQRTRKKG